MILCVILLLAGIAGSFWVFLTPHGKTVQIVQNGVVLYTFDLAVAEDRTIQVEYEGRINTVQIQNGRIRMLEADCPDHTCIHMGWLDSVAPIVCLPNHLVIQFTDTDENADMGVQ